MSADHISDPSRSQLPDQEETIESAAEIPEELQLVVVLKLGNLSKVVTNIEKLEQTAFDKVEKAVTLKETNMLSLLENQFEEYHAQLEKKKNELRDKITSHFRQKKEVVLVRHNPYDSQYESKGKVIEWKNMVKRKMDKWETEKTIETANDIIEEDETAMGSDIKSWGSKVESILSAENQEIFVDKSFLVFDENFSKAISSLCEHKVIQEESLFEKIIKGENDRNQIIKSEGDRETLAQNQKLFEKIFKTHSINIDAGMQGPDTIRLTPSNSILSSSPDKAKIKQEAERLASIQTLKAQCIDFKSKSLQSFSNALPLFINLKELSINLEFNEKFNDSAFENLSFSFSSLYQLESLSIGLQADCSKVTGFGFYTLIENICRLQKLSQVSLAFGAFSNMIETTFIDSVYALRELHHLTDLKLTLPTLPAIGDKGIERISSLLEQNKEFKSFDISFAADNKLTDVGFSKLCNAISLNKDLTVLKINVKDKVSGISDQGFSSFVKALSKLRVLNSLSLALPEAHVTNEEFTNFSNVLVNNAFLKELSLNFAWTHVNDIGLADFGNRIGSLMYLEDLSLNFKACSVANDGFIDLLRGVSKLFNLSKLELDLSWCKGITDEGLVWFGEEVQKMNGLCRLLLKFEESKKITENGMVKLCGGLGGLDCLAHLQIYLIKCGRDLTEDMSKGKLEQALISKRRHFIKNIWIKT